MYTTKHKVPSPILLLIFYLISSVNAHASKSIGKHRDKPLTVSSLRFASGSVVDLFCTASSAFVNQQVMSSSLFLYSITCLLSPFSLKKYVIEIAWEKLSRTFRENWAEHHIFTLNIWTKYTTKEITPDNY